MSEGGFTGKFGVQHPTGSLVHLRRVPEATGDSQTLEQIMFTSAIALGILGGNATTHWEQYTWATMTIPSIPC